jgi:hypothetical protein
MSVGSSRRRMPEGRLDGKTGGRKNILCFSFELSILLFENGVSRCP